MKNVISALIIGFIFVGISKIIKEDKISNSSYNNRIVVSCKKKSKKKIEHNVSERTDLSPTETIVIKGLGDINEQDKIYTSDIIKNFYGYNCIIDDNIDIPSNIYSHDNIIDAPKTMVEFNDNIKTIYLTYNGIVENSSDLRGYTTLYGKSIIVRSDRSFMKETILHEIGHTLGLEHCDNLSCIMAIANDSYETGKFCDNCKSKINK